MTMDALNENVPANFAFLVGAGVVMILTLWTSRKAMHVTETELSLASQNDEQEQREYGSSAFAAPSSARRSTPTMPSSGSFPNGSARRSPAASK